MNYIKELNAFYDWLETNELSPSAVNLWYALLHINNKAGWCHSFCVAESVLHVKTGLSDRTIRKARAELKEKNRIDFCSRKGGRAPVYTIISFFSAEKSAAARTEENAVAKAQSATPAAQLLQPKHPNLVQSFAANFHYQPSPTQVQLLSSYIDQNGMDEELVIWAINDTGQRGKPFEYVRTMLNRLSEKKIHTVTEAISAREEYKKSLAQKTNVRPFRKNVSPSPVPEWVGDHQHSLSSFTAHNEGENMQWLDGILEGL